MLSEREIRLRHVKYAAAYDEFISFHFPRKRKISQCPKVIISYPKDISLHSPSFLLYNQFDKSEFSEVLAPPLGELSRL